MLLPIPVTLGLPYGFMFPVIVLFFFNLHHNAFWYVLLQLQVPECSALSVTNYEMSQIVPINVEQDCHPMHPLLLLHKAKLEPMCASLPFNTHESPYIKLKPISCQQKSAGFSFTL